MQSINADNYVLALGWGRQSNILASAGYKGVMDIWSVASGENMLRIAGHTAAVKALAWAPPRGDYLASAGEDRVIRLWDLNERKEFSQLIPGHGGPVEDLAWSRDGGAYLASCGHDFFSLSVGRPGR